MNTQSNVPIVRTLECSGDFEDVRGILKRLGIVFHYMLKNGKVGGKIGGESIHWRLRQCRGD